MRASVSSSPLFTFHFSLASLLTLARDSLFFFAETLSLRLFSQHLLLLSFVDGVLVGLVGRLVGRQAGSSSRKKDERFIRVRIGLFGAWTVADLLLSEFHAIKDVQ